MANWHRIDKILRSAYRLIGSDGIVLSHTIQTPDMVELQLLLEDARHESETAEMEETVNDSK